MHRVPTPSAVVFIALFQFFKAAVLLAVAALLWLAPQRLPQSEYLTNLLFIAAHGRSVPAIMVPIFGLYVAYVGWGLLRLNPAIRNTLAISSAITIAISLERLGLFGEASVSSAFDRETLYILILFDTTVYIYLTLHPNIRSAFQQQALGAPPPAEKAFL